MQLLLGLAQILCTGTTELIQFRKCKIAVISVNIDLKDLAGPCTIHCSPVDYKLESAENRSVAFT